MLGVLNKKISIEVGVIVLLSVAFFAGWTILKQYESVMEMRFEKIELEIYGEKK